MGLLAADPALRENVRTCTKCACYIKASLRAVGAFENEYGKNCFATYNAASVSDANGAAASINRNGIIYSIYIINGLTVKVNGKKDIFHNLKYSANRREMARNVGLLQAL